MSGWSYENSKLIYEGRVDKENVNTVDLNEHNDEKNRMTDREAIGLGDYEINRPYVLNWSKWINKTHLSGARVVYNNQLYEAKVEINKNSIEQYKATKVSRKEGLQDFSCYNTIQGG